MVRNGDLIGIKRNLYVLSRDYRKPYSKEVLAGMIYGPSAISFEYALSLHGLIPERVEKVTSICFKRNKQYETPVGIFQYRYIAEKKYSVGIEYRQTDLGNYLLASREKALCDLLYQQTSNQKDCLIDYLISGLRIDESNIAELSLELLIEIASIYRKTQVDVLVETITNFQGAKENE